MYESHKVCTKCHKGQTTEEIIAEMRSFPFLETCWPPTEEGKYQREIRYDYRDLDWKSVSYIWIENKWWPYEADEGLYPCVCERDKI